MRRARTFLIGLSVVGAVAVSGCSFTGIYDLPLPGGADVGSHPYTVRAQFRDVLDLVPQSGVKVNQVAVGRVEHIDVAPDGWSAEVTMLVNGDVHLPANALARVRQTSLLGEKYIELSPPPSAAEGTLANNALIGLDRTNRNTEIEEVLGALSMLLNGGGLDQLQTISRELNNALSGNETQIRATLDDVTSLVSTLDANKGDITQAIDGLNRLASTLNGQRDQIAGVIDNITPGLTVLNEQRTQLVSMLQALQSLSGVAVDTVNKSKADLVADLKDLVPSLGKLAEAGDSLPKALEVLITLPFPDSAVDAVKGSDYFNLYLNLDLDFTDLVNNLVNSQQNPLGALSQVPGIGGLVGGTAGQQPAQLPLPNLGGLLPGGTQSGQSGQSGSSSGLGGLFDVLIGGGS